MHRIYGPLRALSTIVLLLMLAALIYAGWISIQNWHGIAV